MISASHRKTDVMVSSALAPVAFPASDALSGDSYSLFFQCAAGTMKFTTRSGISGVWNPALYITPTADQDSMLTAQGMSSMTH